MMSLVWYPQEVSDFEFATTLADLIVVKNALKSRRRKTAKTGRLGKSLQSRRTEPFVTRVAFVNPATTSP